MKMRHYIPLIASLAVMTLPAAAQDYEDDIYYNPDKAKKTAPAPQKQTQNAYITGARTSAPVAADYPAADTYTPAPGAGLQMNVDEYNRRVPASTPDSVAGAPESDADFTYTRRLERFHNPDIVAQSGDEELVEYYYATEQPTVINVNVIDIDPWNWWGPSWGWRYSSWYSPYWNPYYSFGWGPSWNWGWGPSWSWGWGGWYDPYWSWAGGWGPAWGWGPALPPPGPSWGGNHAWRPSGPGSNRPHRPATGSGMASTHRPGNNGLSTNRRPGNNGYGAAAMRPGASGRPSSSGTTTMGRGRYGNNRTGISSGNRMPNRPTGATVNGTTRRATGINSTGGYNTRRSTGSTNLRNNSVNSSTRSTSTRNTGTRSTGSYNTGRSHSGGGSFGGGRSTGGGGGSHSGGGSRGRR